MAEHPPVPLAREEWNYLAVIRTPDAFKVYLDGEPIASKTASDIQMEDSPLPLQIGNWLGNDRPFNGAMKEFRVLKRIAGTGRDCGNRPAHLRELR